MQLDYNEEKFTKVSVCGIECDFSDMHMDRSTVPSGLYQYEVADDDKSQGDSTRIKNGIMVNFWGTTMYRCRLGAMVFWGWMMEILSGYEDSTYELLSLVQIGGLY